MFFNPVYPFNEAIYHFFQRPLNPVKGKTNCPNESYFLPLISFPRFRKQESSLHLYVEMHIVSKISDVWRVLF